MNLITGGNGFIGSHLARRLRNEGNATHIVDLQAAPDQSETTSQIDIRDLPAVREIMAGVERVYHQAALVSVPESMADPLRCHEINATGTLHVLLAARDAGARRVVLASSSAVYGNDPAIPKCETMPSSLLSPYAASKLAGEALGQIFTRAYGLETVALRYFNVYGPGQSTASAYAAVIPKFIGTMVQGGIPVIYGDGRQTRDFVFVDDVVQANLLAGHRTGIGGELFNIGSGTQISLNDLLETIAGILGIVPRAGYRPERAGDVRHSVADISKARSLLGFAPAVSLEDGLRRTVEWFTSVP